VDTHALIFRNKVMFYLISSIVSLLTVVNIMAGKSRLFITSIFVSGFLLLGVTGYYIFKKKTRHVLCSHLFTHASLGVITLVLFSDPSFDKFIFLFLALMIPVLYQNSWLTIANGLFVGIVMSIAYATDKQAIWGGYDIVKSKSLIFSLALTILFVVLSVTQSRASEKLRKDALKSENNAILEKKKAEELLVRLEKTLHEIESFNVVLDEGTEMVKQNSEQIVFTSQEMSQSIENQTVEISSFSSFVHKTKENYSDIVKDFTEMNEKSKETKESISISTDKFKELEESLSYIKNFFYLNKHTNEQLKNKTNEIQRIMTIISGISNQTNLLALNASIEASRAGEHGASFMVVADEIRKLADQTNRSTKDIELILTDVNEKVEESFLQIHKSEKVFVGNKKKTAEVKESFDVLKKNNQQVEEKMKMSIIKVEKLQRDIQQALESIVNISSIAEENFSSVQKITTSYKKVDEMIAELTENYHFLHAKIKKK